MVWMSRRYTFAHAYRIVFVCLAAMALGGKPLYRYLMTFQPIAELMNFVSDDEVLQMLKMNFSVNLLRVLAAEIVAHSMIKAYVPANKSFGAPKARARGVKPGRARSPMDMMVDRPWIRFRF